MDVPAEPLTSTQDDKLPELSRSQTNLDVAAGFPVLPVPVSSATTPLVNKRKSLRLRPDEILNLQDADPLPLMNAPPTTPAPQLRARTSAKMSLFNLFSKPKVEKLRGYAEPGMDGPPHGCSISAASTSRPAPFTRTQHADPQTGMLRPSTSKSYSSKAAKLAVKEPSPSLPINRTARMRSFDPPPLFQVWPQAIRHALFEVATMAPDMALQKSKNRKLGATLLVPNADIQSLQMPGSRASIDSRMTTKTTARYLANGSISHPNLPTKLIVLVTSGYLLQYSATGDQQRYPEKILQLQKESAAYASDLIPGKHHVLQVVQLVQSVNDGGVVVAPTSGLFSKFGLRSQVARRTTSNLLLVMPGAEDMDEWMTAIRKEIERQGGKRARSGSSSSRAREDEARKFDLRKTPSLSHRYQVTRHASIANVSPVDAQAELKATSPGIAEEKSCNKATDKSTERQQKSPFDETASPRSRAGSDTPSISSSTAASEGQKQLDKLRDSTRSSHASTMATTVASMTSRTNSITSTPTESSRETHELQQDYVTAKGPYRNLSSYSIPKRRSAAPLLLPLSNEPISPRTAVLREAVEQPLESPLLKHPVYMVQSVPNLKHKGKLNFETPPHAGPQVRPESFLADLPDPSTYTSNLQHSQSNPEIPQVRTLHSVQTRPFRHGSQSFSLPLRVNTNNTVVRRSVFRRASQSTEADAGLRSPIPAATTLIAKVDATTVSAHQAGPVTRQMTFAEHAAVAATAKAQPRRASATTMSLFPPVSPVVPTQSTSSVEGLRRSPSMATCAVSSALPQQALRRPGSLQVRTDHAPFLSSLRLSPVSPNTRPSATRPIRSLKPSRSATAVSGSVPRAPSAADTLNFSTRRVTGEEADQAMPLPTRCDSPFKSTSSRKVRASASLPELDFGMPLICLGPPCAPPPCAPLPELPPAGRPSSRAGSRTVSRSGSRQEVHSRSCTPIGVALSGSPSTAHAPSAPSIPSVGLCIEVGWH